MALGALGNRDSIPPPRCLAEVRAAENRCKLEKHIPRAILAGLQTAASSHLKELTGSGAEPVLPPS